MAVVKTKANSASTQARSASRPRNLPNARAASDARAYADGGAAEL